MWRQSKKILRDIALTLYDHPSEFKCLGWPRLWGTIFAVELVVLVNAKIFFGYQVEGYVLTALTTGLGICFGGYGWKKYIEGKKEIAGIPATYNSQEANMKP